MDKTSIQITPEQSQMIQIRLLAQIYATNAKMNKTLSLLLERINKGSSLTSEEVEAISQVLVQKQAEMEQQVFDGIYDYAATFPRPE